MNDITQAAKLVADAQGRALIGDRAYDSNALIQQLEGRGLNPIIPARSNRRQSRVIDLEAYKRRNVIERWFGRLKAFRRVATRYDKTTVSFVGFVALGTTVMAQSG